MEKEIKFKQQYKAGLDLLKADINKCKNNKLYSPIVPYFEYPISLMEKDVAKVSADNKDTEDYYEDKCKQIEELYNRLTMTIAIISRNFTPFSTNITRSYERIKYKLTKRK